MASYGATDRGESWPKETGVLHSSKAKIVSKEVCENLNQDQIVIFQGIVSGEMLCVNLDHDDKGKIY